MTTTASINVLAELERLGWKFQPVGDSEVKCLCPAHADTNPSTSLNVNTGLWECKACAARGDFISFLSYALSCSRQATIIELSSRYDMDKEKSISPEVVEKMHGRIWEAGPLLVALRNRGLTDEMLRTARIGYHDGRITIPVYDINGRVVNIRRYLPGGPPEKKMLNTKGHGKLRIYQPSEVSYEKLLICGGEMKALVAKFMLNKHGYGCISTTAGEGSWDSRWSEQFKAKKVWICMDIDDAGRNAALKVAQHLASFAEFIKIVVLPLDNKQFPKGDINDWVHAGATPEDFVELLEKSEMYQPVDIPTVTDLGTKAIDIASTTAPENIGWRLEFKATVAAADTTPFLAPAIIDVHCSRDQPGCFKCPIKKVDSTDGRVRMDLAATSGAMLDIVNSPSKLKNNAIREGLGIPSCAAVEFHVITHRTIYDARLAPQLEIGNANNANVLQPALIADSTFDLNTPYMMVGKLHPHPKTQQATLVIDTVTETEDSLDSFKPSPTELDQLLKFQPPEWTVEGIDSIFNEIYTDLEVNVTRIFGRRDLHIALDLTFMSPLFFTIEGRRVNGWLNSLVVGDSSQGKSETSTRMMEHYSLGERIDCKNATVAGLLGGLQQMGNRWFVSWGVIPTHDRRLVVMEELKGASIEVLSKLTDMRSSGIAEIPKIERRRTPARTRLAMLSNPRSSRPMSSYSFGVQAVAELVGNLEDVRRYDYAVAVTAGTVDVRKMSKPPASTPRFTSDICRRLVLWAWTRSIEEVVFEVPAEKAVVVLSQNLSDTYSEAIPLVDRGTIRHKLAKISAAVAAKTFSRDGDTLVIRECHVQWAYNWLTSVYSGSEMGYADYSKAQRSLTDMDETAVRKYVMHQTRHPFDFIKGLLTYDELTPQDVQDLCEVNRESAQAILSFLVRKQAIKRSTGSFKVCYVKSAPFIQLLKQLEKEPVEHKETTSEF